MKRFIFLLIIPLLASCSSTKTLKYAAKSDEVVNTQTLKDFLVNNKNPKVVLRVNGSSQSITDSENNDYLYNAIENELLASDFVVRDRQLFNQIIGNENNNIDYQKLKEKSDTELIIELTKLDPKVLYETNVYYDKNNRPKVENSYTYKRYGAVVEFKIVLIKSNDFAGVYKFNYTPCVDGCIISKSIKDLKKEIKLFNKNKTKPYEGVEKDVLEEFMKTATRRLVNSMRS